MATSARLAMEALAAKGTWPLVVPAQLQRRAAALATACSCRCPTRRAQMGPHACRPAVPRLAPG